MAIANLQKRMPQEIAQKLKDAVSARGMKPFLLHETVAKDIFNLAFSSGDSEKEAWCVQLTNTDTNGLVARLKGGAIVLLRVFWAMGSTGT